uniref:Uncharacterized protein n=1 Tax=Phlebotomus papatasi TaxID=29031 RepID=A0A1B0D5N2_PHLPP
MSESEVSEVLQTFLDTLNYKQKAYWKVLEEEIGGEIPARLKYILHKFDYTTIGGWTLFELCSDITMMEIDINETIKDGDPELTYEVESP